MIQENQAQMISLWGISHLLGEKSAVKVEAFMLINLLLAALNTRGAKAGFISKWLELSVASGGLLLRRTGVFR